MHEFGIAEAVVGAVERRADGRRVRRARVRAGALLRIAPSAMDQAFCLAALGTVAEGATLDLVIEPVRLVCRDCGHTALSADPLTICGLCGGIDVDAEGGDRLVLESIQIAEASPVFRDTVFRDTVFRDTVSGDTVSGDPACGDTGPGDTKPG